MQKRRIIALLTFAALVIAAGVYALQLYFTPIPMLSHREDAEIIQIEAERNGELVAYTLSDSGEAELLDILAQANMVKTLKKAGVFAYGDFAFILHIRDGDDTWQMHLGPESEISDCYGATIHHIEHNEQVVADITHLIETDDCIVERSLP